MEIPDVYRSNNPGDWPERMDFCSRLSDHGWRWEFIRRSKVFQNEADFIKQHLNDQANPVYSKLLSRFTFKWQLFGGRSNLALVWTRYALSFSEVLTVLSLDYGDSGWRSTIRLIAEVFSSSDDKNGIPPDFCQIFYENRYCRKVAVRFPMKDPVGMLFQREIEKDPPSITKMAKITKDGLIFFLPPDGWEKFPTDPLFGGGVNKIVRAMRNAYGVNMEKVTPWNDRAKCDFFPQQIKALDVHAGIITKDESGLNPTNFSRTLKAAQDKIRRIEQAAHSRGVSLGKM